MDTFRRRLRQTSLRRVFILGLALVLLAGSATALEPAFGWEGGRNWRYLTPEEAADYQAPAPPPSNRQYRQQQQPRQPPRPSQFDSRKTLAASVPLLKRMIQLAADDGGVNHITELHDLKRRIDALPKPPPGNAKAAQTLFAKGAAAYESGLLDDAARYYADARKLDPSDVQIVANLGFTYVKLGNLKAAIEPLTTAATMAPGRSGRWANLAEYYARNGQSQEAVACYALAVHFSRNPLKTVEFITQRVQDPDPKVQQAAQQALQLSFIQSINAPEDATLEAPLASVQPEVAPPPVAQPAPPAPVQPAPQPAPQPEPTTAASEEPAPASALPPNPVTVLDSSPAPAAATSPTCDRITFRNCLEMVGQLRGCERDTPAQKLYQACERCASARGVDLRSEPGEANRIIENKMESTQEYATVGLCNIYESIAKSLIERINSITPVLKPPSVEQPDPKAATPPVVQDSTWYVITKQQTCDATLSPADLIRLIHNEGYKPEIQEFRDANGKLIKVEVSESYGLLTQTVTFYRAKADCEAALAAKTAIPDEYK